jgi:hypothetical protein
MMVLLVEMITSCISVVIALQMLVNLDSDTLLAVFSSLHVTLVPSEQHAVQMLQVGSRFAGLLGSLLQNALALLG